MFYKFNMRLNSIISVLQMEELIQDHYSQPLSFCVSFLS